MGTEPLRNFIDGEWRKSVATEHLDISNPATGEILGRVPLSPAREVEEAARAATEAFPGWRETPPTERVQYLFKLKTLIEEQFEDLSRTITLECGKTLVESRGEIERAIENVDAACGIPALMSGTILENIAPGIDEFMVRQPIGVGAVIAPFNFPAMIPFWFFPYAVACGNTYIVKPSERVPHTMQKLFQLVEKVGFPKGVLNLVNGSREAAEAILDHPNIRAISFVGTTALARHVYARAAAKGKRVQCQGGAKNPIVVLPDADLEMTARICANSALGCAGQRCLAASLAITVGEARQSFTDALAAAASSRKVGNGLEDGVEMGPVITAESKQRIEQLIAKGAGEGARVLVDGRNTRIKGYEGGNFLRPTLLDYERPQGEVLQTEIFGPVLTLLHANTVEDAITLINNGRYGNMACLFTESGAAARKFRHEVEAGNIGINIGVAAPTAPFPFSGARESFFGDLHGQGHDAVDFFTQKKVVVERWPKESNP